MKYKKLTLGQIEALINKLGGETEVRDFLAGKFTFLKQEVEQKVRTLSKSKVLYFVRREHYQDSATGKGVLFLSDDHLKELFCSLVENKFPELSELSFRENKEYKRKENESNERIITIVDVTPTRIAQEMFFVMQEKYPRGYKTYEWFFTNEGMRYQITLSFLEEKGTLRNIFLMNCRNLSAS